MTNRVEESTFPHAKFYNAIYRTTLTILLLLPISIFTIASASAAEPQALSKTELQSLVEPVALYPDPLLQTLLAASTFPDQIVDAGLLIKSQNDASLIQGAKWDDSVKIIATYPGVLSMMYKRIDWTAQLGETFLSQHKDVLAAIQLQRTQAFKTGELKTSEHQEVSTVQAGQGQTVVVIQPSDPEVIYVPYDSGYAVTNTSYTESALVPVVSFGLGLALGAAIADNDDNYYYGGGWGWGAPSYWYDDSPYNQWMDQREQRWNDTNDMRWDRQQNRQEASQDRREFRQDQIASGHYTPPTQEQRAAAKDRAETRRQEAPGSRDLFDNSSGKGAQAREQYAAARDGSTAKDLNNNYSSKRANSDQAASRQAAADRASARTNSAVRTGMESGTRGASRDYSAPAKDPFSRSASPTYNSRPSSSSQNRSAFSGYNSRSQTSAYSSRGAASRGGGGYGGGARGGGARGGGGRGGGRR